MLGFHSSKGLFDCLCDRRRTFGCVSEAVSREVSLMWEDPWMWDIGSQTAEERASLAFHSPSSLWMRKPVCCLLFTAVAAAAWAGHHGECWPAQVCSRSLGVSLFPENIWTHLSQLCREHTTIPTWTLGLSEVIPIYQALLEEGGKQRKTSLTSSTPEHCSPGWCISDACPTHAIGFWCIYMQQTQQMLLMKLNLKNARVR